MEEPNILIKTALTEAVQKVNEGMSPTEALKKVANDMDLNPNYIQRTGEALNVALHYKHFKTASDRSTEFEIADIPKAVGDVFTIAEKTAAEYASENYSSSESNETVFNYNRMLTNPVYKRAFLEISEAKEKNDSFETTFNTVYEKSANYINKLEKDAEASDVAKVAAEISLNHQFSSLSDEFKKDAGYRSSFEEFESQVFAKHGEESVQYLDLLHKVACPGEERGVHDSKYITFEQSKEASLFDDLMLAASEMIESVKTAEDIQEYLNSEKSFMKECKMMLGKTARMENIQEPQEKLPEVEEAEEQESEDPVLAMVKKKVAAASQPQDPQDPVLKEAMQKEAFGGMIGGFGKMLADLTQAPITEAFHSALKKPPLFSSGKPNLTMDNMERKLLLQELMMTDPILSKVNPAKVARAFEQILRLSPEISKEKEVVRAELRAMVSTQALSKYDAELMSKLDLGMLKRRVATQLFNKGTVENFKI